MTCMTLFLIQHKHIELNMCSKEFDPYMCREEDFTVDKIPWQYILLLYIGLVLEKTITIALTVGRNCVVYILYISVFPLQISCLNSW